ncbi:hypothetical protein [Flavobacterium luminosum]|uniref:Uncharacterized protein n=1 Tax=Flavobacterium luminosum TaxID=2949086 RepID=A0ABT0TQY4_9FLAO|nr:hypothetical protein [Flavobacterium sp. HXWNR70]MCL9809903.1 hypothetical protein [Flavobacterium sp. HXWNR70]
MHQEYVFPVKIDEVYFENWVAGIRGGGSGTNFHIRFSQGLPKEIKIQQLYFRGKVESLQPIDNFNYLVSFKGNANWDRADIMESDFQKKQIL